MLSNVTIVRRHESIPNSAWMIVTALLVGWSAMYLPTYMALARTFWAGDEQGHGPIILAVCGFLLYQRRFDLAGLRNASNPYSGALLLFVGLMLYILGRSQSIFILDAGSQIIVLAAILVSFKGWRGLGLGLFPVLFLAFMIPLPAALVAAVTAPLKLAVSAAASTVLYTAGYPIGRSGVTLTIGQYQLLVADACAGLNSMFTLEALGLLYLNIMRYAELRRNIVLAVAIIPISFCSNVIRVMVLVLVTYYFGDAAGQGFVHGFAGMLLFLVALGLIIAADVVYGRVTARSSR